MSAAAELFSRICSSVRKVQFSSRVQPMPRKVFSYRFPLLVPTEKAGSVVSGTVVLGTVVSGAVVWVGVTFPRMLLPLPPAKART